MITCFHAYYIHQWCSFPLFIKKAISSRCGISRKKDELHHQASSSIVWWCTRQQASFLIAEVYHHLLSSSYTISRFSLKTNAHDKKQSITLFVNLLFSLMELLSSKMQRFRIQLFKVPIKCGVNMRMIQTDVEREEDYS